MAFSSSQAHHSIPYNLGQLLDKTKHEKKVEIAKEKIIPVFRVKGLHRSKEQVRTKSRYRWDSEKGAPDFLPIIVPPCGSG